jgi:PAS domain S-box-containing protein
MLQIELCPKGNHHRAKAQSPLFVILDGFDRRWLYVSREFAELLGYSPEELVGKTTEQMMPRAQYDPNLFDRLLENESLELQYIFRRKNGTNVSVMASLTVLEDGCIVGLARPY